MEVVQMAVRSRQGWGQHWLWWGTGWS